MEYNHTTPKRAEGRNNYLSDSYPNKSGYRGGPPRRDSKKRKKRQIPLSLVFIIDVAIAAAALFIFSLYYFILPRDLSQNAQVLPGAKTSDAVASALPSNTDTPSASPAASDEQSSEAPSAAEDGSSWRAKFADKFVSGDPVKTDNSYKSANVSVTIDTVAKDGVTYFVADIYLADIKYFKTAFAQDTFGSGIHEFTTDIASKNNAVIAINGDYCGTNSGPVVRNGVLYRDEKYTADVLVMNNDGSMQTFSPDEFDMDKIKSEGAYQVWTFGPMLLKDGQPMDSFNSSVNPRNPRTAVGYFEPGHYCFVVVDGRQPDYSEGYSTKELSDLFFSLGCQAAYNMDGGQSSEMAFNGAFYNKPYKGGRGTSDILYIADE